MPRPTFAAAAAAFQRLTLVGKLLTVSAAAVAGLLLAGFSLVIFQTHGVVAHISNDMAFADARSRAESVRTEVMQIASGAKAVSVVVGNIYETGATRERVLKELRSYVDVTPMEFGVWHMAEPNVIGNDADYKKQPGADVNGHFAPWWLRPGGKVVLDPVDSPAAYDAEYYKKARDEGKPALVEPYAYPVSGVNYTMMSLVYPVRHAGRIIGVVGIDMALDEITQRLAEARPLGVGRLYLVTQAGTWLANPDADKRMKPYADPGKAELDRVLASGQPASVRFSGKDGVSYTRFFQPVDLGTFGARWVLISEIPSAVISAPATALGWKLILSGVFVTLGLMAALWFAVRHIIGAPMHALADTVDRLAHGESLAVPSLDRADEIGKLARAADLFRQAAEDRAIADARAAEEQAEVTAQVGTGLAALREGDLTARIDAAFPPAYAALRDNFNAAVESLRGLIAAVATSAEGIRGGSVEIASASDDLARRTESNAASLEQTSAAVTQIDHRLRASASAAQTTVTRANEAIHVVDDGKQRALSAVDAMERVSESAKGIDSVIEALDKIAFQTRVLAMNAAVEAGRAGEAGRGFAVVADLVSALAMRSEEEAARAHEQLDSAQTEIKAAVSRVEEVDGAFERVLEQVRGVHDLVSSIAEDNRVQSTSITEISTAIAEMDRSTQQNAAMVEQTSAAARNLQHESATLAERTTRFKVSEGGSGRRPSARGSGSSAPARELAYH